MRETDDMAKYGEPHINIVLTRRWMTTVLAGVGIGVALSPLAFRAAAAEIRMQAAVFFEPHIPSALRRALQIAADARARSNHDHHFEL